ncbi:MAG: hypothetical protein FWD31_00940, partial [Planctomycetaceae bacterium]|nr:hypothetical protein [Planctomycetaceae bacterium]
MSLTKYLAVVVVACLMLGAAVGCPNKAPQQKQPEWNPNRNSIPYTPGPEWFRLTDNKDNYMKFMENYLAEMQAMSTAAGLAYWDASISG